MEYPTPAKGSPVSATSSAPLVLEPPEPVAAPTPEQAPEMVPLADDKSAWLDEIAAQFVADLAPLDPSDPAFTAKGDQVRAMGDREVRESSAMSSRLLNRSMVAMRDGGGDGVPQTLLDLRRTVESLDPSQTEGAKKFLGFLPRSAKLEDYFRKYESSQTQLDKIITALENGREALLRDNADLAVEKQNLWVTIGRLRQYIYMVTALDAKLVAEVDRVRAVDEERASAIESEILFYVRQKHQDLLTQLAVAINGYLAIDLIRRNNLELIKGVERATTTTLAALRTAIIVAQSLTTQRLVLNQITALNSTTSAMIGRTSDMLRTQSAQIQQSAATTTLDMEQLRRAFANVYQTMDAIDTFKAAALVSMKTTIDGLTVEVNKADEYVQRASGRLPQTSPDATSTDFIPLDPDTP